MSTRDLALVGVSLISLSFIMLFLGPEIQEFGEFLKKKAKFQWQLRKGRKQIREVLRQATFPSPVDFTQKVLIPDTFEVVLPENEASKTSSKKKSPKKTSKRKQKSKKSKTTKKTKRAQK